jgi:hypothetical protein
MDGRARPAGRPVVLARGSPAQAWYSTDWMIPQHGRDPRARRVIEIAALRPARNIRQGRRPGRAVARASPPSAGWIEPAMATATPGPNWT